MVLAKANGILLSILDPPYENMQLHRVTHVLKTPFSSNKWTRPFVTSLPLTM